MWPLRRLYSPFKGVCGKWHDGPRSVRGRTELKWHTQSKRSSTLCRAKGQTQVARRFSAVLLDVISGRVMRKIATLRSVVFATPTLSGRMELAAGGSKTRLSLLKPLPLPGQVGKRGIHSLSAQ